MADLDESMSGLSNLSVEIKSIASPEAKPGAAKVSREALAVKSELSGLKSEGSTEAAGPTEPELPEVELKKVPNKATPIKPVLMPIDYNGWPAFSLFEPSSWALHVPNLDPNSCKSGIRVMIAKAETHGPKTTPYTTYIMHIKTAFSVRSISRRYSDFKDLDENLRMVRRTAPVLPRKKTFGKMSPKFITERKRQLQLYIGNILMDPDCANSEPFRAFLGTKGHHIEEEILARKGPAAEKGVGPFVPWHLQAGHTEEAFQQVVQQCQTAKDKRQEARVLNQLAIYLCTEGERVKALQAMREAFACCRQVEDQEGLLACALTWACVHTHFGEYSVAEERIREAMGIAASLDDMNSEANCHRLLSIIKNSGGHQKEAAKEALIGIEKFVAGKDLGSAATTQHMLGSILYDCGEVRQAVQVLECSMLFRRQARDKLGLAETLCALGQAFADIGYQLHAMDYFDQALALSQEIGDRQGEAICLRHLGRVHHMHGDHHEALSAFDKSATLSVRLDDEEGQTFCHEGMADVHLDLGDAKLSIVHLEEALQICKSMTLPSQALDKVDEGDDGVSHNEASQVDEDQSANKKAPEDIAGDEDTSGGLTESDQKWMKTTKRIKEKLEKAKSLAEQTLAAHDDYDRTIRKGTSVEDRVIGGESKTPSRYDEDGGVIIPDRATDPQQPKKGPKFPLKFKLKMPGQNMSSHLKFLQNWSVHKKYYATSEQSEET